MKMIQKLFRTSKLNYNQAAKTPRVGEGKSKVHVNWNLHFYHYVYTCTMYRLHVLTGISGTASSLTQCFIPGLHFLSTVCIGTPITPLTLSLAAVYFTQNESPSYVDLWHRSDLMASGRPIHDRRLNQS